ncbi:hypothetical protein [Micromonospora sp. CPCC 206061]|uniref:hypothetical protein n=1 Tax=Micromonospora sp. CPCC 206061 TaxID=3122410 RepID=UPI002FF1D950
MAGTEADGAEYRAARRRMNQFRWSAMGLAAAGAAGLVFASGIASADPAPPRVVGGNPNTCAAAGLGGTILLSSSMPSETASSGTVSGNGLLLDVTINSGFTASGIVVKGGPRANAYNGPFTGPVTIEDLRAPTNPGGQQPQISHWFVCGGQSPKTTPPATPTSKPPTTRPTTAPTTRPPTTPPMTPPTTAPVTTPPTTAPPTVVPTTPPSTGGDLPTTGTRAGLFIGSAVALLAAGVLLVAFVRRRRFVA